METDPTSLYRCVVHPSTNWHFVCILGAYFRCSDRRSVQRRHKFDHGFANGFGEQGFLIGPSMRTTSNYDSMIKTFYLINYLIFGDFIQGYLIVNWLLILGLCIYLFIIIAKSSEKSGIHSSAGNSHQKFYDFHPAWNITAHSEILASLFFLRSLQIILSGGKKYRIGNIRHADDFRQKERSQL